jgi:tetrahydromethanopterin S-methyltransferase subunit G
MQDKILKRLDSIDKKLDQHTKKLDQHTKILDQHTKILDQHTQILDQHTQRLDHHDELFERNEKAHEAIVKKLLEHDNRFDVLEGKVDRNHSEVLERFDIMMGILTRLDHERYAGITRDDRIEKKVNKHEIDIKNIKKELKIA